MRNTKTLVGSLIGVALLSLTVLTPARATVDAARAHADAQAAPAYPLKVGPTGRYLADRHGVPVLLTGDSPQALTVNLSPHQADGFFADRKAAGFNAMWVNLLCSTYTGGRPDGSTYDGIVPGSSRSRCPATSPRRTRRTSLGSTGCSAWQPGTASWCFSTRLRPGASSPSGSHGASASLSGGTWLLQLAVLAPA